ncbi:TetR family transcriptional regulator [Falsiroseomonas oryziterrae]|uniref:TetR family transcriptional regulator n=1 Tax=Falsiroseomonas oryziterrae TaxID=2911368 RepID=UPI001EFFDFBA|nr:TetR family transcriptional regulator [Roseomonas sp. NPKOSM-4]
MKADAALIEALFRVVATHGWRGVTVTRLAQESGVAAGELVRRFPSRLGLLRLFADQVMDEVAAGTVPGQGGTPRDRLFDVLMRGLDALAPYKAGMRRLMTEMYTDGVLFGAVAPLFQRSMERMLDLAELDAGGLKGRLRAAGLTLVWIRVVNVWSKDTSEELGPTMAALDRALERAEQAARSFGLDGGDLAAPPPDMAAGTDSTAA